jgi:hypothetical protein
VKYHGKTLPGNVTAARAALAELRKGIKAEEKRAYSLSQAMYHLLNNYSLDPSEIAMIQAAGFGAALVGDPGGKRNQKGELKCTT